MTGTENSNMKTRVLSGLFWKLLENGGAQGVQFLISLVLARILGPKEYGTVGLITIFIIIANVFIQSGFQTSLIQKKDVEEVDFSSVFYLSLAVAVILYLILFAAAPAIGAFYEEPVLVPMVRVLSLTLFFGAVISTQSAVVSRNLEFKKMCISSLAAACGSGIIGITAACRGMGVWALVLQQLTNNFLLMTVLWVLVPWRPARMFSLTRLKALFSYGWKLLCSSLLDTIYTNVYGLVIGKIYNKSALGYYNRGNQFPQLIVTNLGTSIQAVMLPAFSASQEDRARVKIMVRRAIVTSSYLIFPMMAGMIAVAKPFVTIVLTDKWLPCVPFLQIMCVAYALWPIHIANLQAINALGRSDIFLKLEIIKKVIGVAALLIGIPFGIYVMVGLKAVTDFIGTFINSYPNKKLLDYSFWEQWRDVIPSLLVSVAMGAAVYSIQFFIANVWILLVVQIGAGIVIYGGLSLLFKLESFMYLRETVMGFIRRRGR